MIVDYKCTFKQSKLWIKLYNYEGMEILMKHCYTACFFMLSILNYDLGIKRCCHENCSFKMPLFHEKSDKLSGLCISKYRLILANNCLCTQVLILADNWVTLLIISENEKNQTWNICSLADHYLNNQGLGFHSFSSF